MDNNDVLSTSFKQLSMFFLLLLGRGDRLINSERPPLLSRARMRAKKRTAKGQIAVDPTRRLKFRNRRRSKAVALHRNLGGIHWESQSIEREQIAPDSIASVSRPSSITQLSFAVGRLPDPN
jgi:hypothetical protein